MLDGGYDLDIEGICQNIDEEDVVSMYFPMLRRTLLLDTRSEKFVRPYIGIVPMVRAPAERFESLKRLRPRLPRPESITIVPWTRRIGALEDAGVWARVIARLEGAGGAAEVARARDCLKQLYAFEQEELANAIRGRQYETIWRNPEPGSAPA